MSSGLAILVDGVAVPEFVDLATTVKIEQSLDDSARYTKNFRIARHRQRGASTSSAHAGSTARLKIGNMSCGLMHAS